MADTFKASAFKVDFHTCDRIRAIRALLEVLTPTFSKGLISIIDPLFYSTPKGSASVIEP